MSKGKYWRKKQRPQARALENASKARLREDSKLVTEHQTGSAALTKSNSEDEMDKSRFQQFREWAKSGSTFTDWCIAAFTFVLSVVAIYQYFVMNGQLGEMRKDQRPWMSISFTLDRFQTGMPVSGSARIINNGKTPAREVAGEISVESVKNGDVPRLDYPLPHTAFTTGLIFPNAPVDFSFGRTDALTEPDLDDFQHTRIFFVVYGIVHYSDFFGIRHWTRWCEFFSPAGVPGTATAKKCTNYGDVDIN